MIKKLEHSNIISLMIIIFILFEITLIYSKYIEAINDVGQYAIKTSQMIAINIDTEKYQEIATTKTKTNYFYSMQKYFSEAANLSNAKYIYVERSLGNNKIEYIFDSTSDSLGEKDETNTPYIYKKRTSFDTGLTTSDKWGTLITGYTPLIDKNNNVVGLVGVDFTLDKIIKIVKNEIIYTLCYILISSIFFIFIIYVLNIQRNNKTKELMHFYRNVVSALANSLSKKSDYTWKHSEKVAEFSEVLSKEFNFPSNKIETIKWAAVLHDIGKIGIPEIILDKPEKLTDEEFDIIKNHPQYSNDILVKIFNKEKHMFNNEDFAIISDIALYHHERWDGRGYPCGLKGDEIPQMARIVSVADAFEAMTSERPYKKPMSKKDALDQIIKGSGTQFDPKVVEVFIKCIKENKIQESPII